MVVADLVTTSVAVARTLLVHLRFEDAFELKCTPLSQLIVQGEAANSAALMTAQGSLRHTGILLSICYSTSIFVTFLLTAVRVQIGPTGCSYLDTVNTKLNTVPYDVTDRLSPYMALMGTVAVPRLDAQLTEPFPQASGMRMSGNCTIGPNVALSWLYQLLCLSLTAALVCVSLSLKQKLSKNKAKGSLVVITMGETMLTSAQSLTMFTLAAMQLQGVDPMNSWYVTVHFLAYVFGTYDIYSRFLFLYALSGQFRAELRSCLTRGIPQLVRNSDVSLDAAVTQNSFVTNIAVKPTEAKN